MGSWRLGTTIIGAVLATAFCGAVDAAQAETPAPKPVEVSYDALFDEVFAHPADLDAAFRFAGLATAKGDYEAAIGALERMLFFNPNLPRVQFELGVLYFRLGSYAMAQSYFETARKAGDVPPDVRSKIDEFLAEIEKRLSPNQLDVTVVTGLRYQTNANAGPDSLIVHALGQDAVLSSEFASTGDWNAFGLVGARYSYDFGNQRGDALEARVTGYYARQFELTDLNLGLVEVEVGPRLGLGSSSSVNVFALGQGELLADEPYMAAYGAGISVRSNIGGVLTVEPSVRYRHRDFQSSDTYPFAAGQAGELVSAALAAGGSLSGLRWVARLGYDNNRVFDEAFEFNSYERVSGEIGLPIDLRLLWGQWRVTPVIGGSITRYAAVNPIVDPNIVREDEEYHYGVTLEHQFNKTFGLRGQVMQTTVRSSLPNYETSNLSAVIGLTYRN